MSSRTRCLQVNHDPAGGPPDALQLVEAAMPVPGPGELLVAVEAAGVNRPDVLQRQGTYPPPGDASPVLGLEVAGRVAVVGPAADGTPSAFAVGDRVCALANGGGYATHCVVPAAQCLSWPDGFDAVRAAALPETLFTVWSNLVRTGRLAAGETLLVHGGSSGIGLMAIQLGRALGAEVIATVGTAAKAALVREHGATAAINYREEDFAERVRELTAARGADVILDMVGGSYLGSNLRTVAEVHIVIGVRDHDNASGGHSAAENVSP
ncbi:MAG: NAD(P)H-quinone oxidoreductase, partial [Gluconacetobacter diazotrophicus]|nr:NAD(P)H-quinone oxidoreductase [Gluconacetobacter diazotrophicus]